MNNISVLLKTTYEKLFLQFGKTLKKPEIKIEFYPYTGINSRVRLRADALHIKISDILIDAPLEIHETLAEILMRKLFRKKVPEALSANYRNYINQNEIREKSVSVRRRRGRKILRGAQGEVYDLKQIFDFLNVLYFKNMIAKPSLTWSADKTYRILGHHDATHETISISKSLDDEKVPRFVVEYVVYHEMLHIKHPTRYVGGRRFIHTPAFKKDEKLFAFFEEAEDWIEQNAKNLKRNAKKKSK